jgi:carbon-monoxide dehydrogenase large subunit
MELGTAAPEKIPEGIGAERFVGRSIPRVEDPRLLTGAGRYTDDLSVPGTLELAFVRSPEAHARIESIDTSAAAELPGVEAVLTAADLDERGLKEIEIFQVIPGQKQETYPILARDKVRYVGDAVAVVLAESRYVAEDATALVEVTYDPLPVVTNARAALEPDSPQLYEDWGENVFCSMTMEKGDAAKAIADADVVISEQMRIHRHTAIPMETRAVLAEVDRHGELTLTISHQAPHRALTQLSEWLDWPAQRMRVLALDVGGGFGLKEHVNPEDALTAYFAVETGRPVKWIEDRAEHFLASSHAREQLHDLELAAKNDGTITGLRDRILADYGGRLERTGTGPMARTLIALAGPYRFQNFHGEAIAVATNKVASGGYRGFGTPQGTFVLERAVDRLARELDMDPAELRRHNFITPDEFPFGAASLVEYDSGDYAATLDQALELAEYSEWRERQPSLWEDGRYVGIGICSYVEPTGVAPSGMFKAVGMRIGGYEAVTVEIDAQGRAEVRTGMVDTGQGHTTSLAQICADTLGVPFDDVTVIQGDTKATPYAPAGSIGSRGAAVGGAAVLRAATRLRQKVVEVAAHMLEAHHEDVEISEGKAIIRGSPEQSVSLRDVAHTAHLAHDIPAEHDPGLYEKEIFDPVEITYAHSTHVAVVEVEPETGELTFHRYVVSHDCGTTINPSIVGGQVVGGVAQGIGGTIYEDLVYTDEGQLGTTTFMDYLIPTATEIPEITLGHTESPSPHVPGGMKGAGEGGAIAPPATIGNAVEDALSPLGVKITETPLTPSAIWQLMQDARANGA